jgi:hypothetical protein
MMITDKKKQKGIVSKVRGAAGSLIQAGLKAQRQMEEWSHYSSLCHVLCSVCSLSARMMGWKSCVCRIKSVLTKADAMVKPYLKSLQSIGWRDSPVIKHLLAVSQRVIPSRVRKEAAAKSKSLALSLCHYKFLSHRLH